MRGSDYGLAWEVVTDPMGELAGHMIGSYGHGGAFGTQGWIDPRNQLISIMLIQRADGGTESMTRIFLNMAEVRRRQVTSLRKSPEFRSLSRAAMPL